MSQTKNKKRRRPHTEAHEDLASVDELKPSASILKSKREESLDTQITFEADRLDGSGLNSDEIELGSADSVSSEGEANEEPAGNPGEPSRLFFVGSELLREKAPQMMELAEKVMHEWREDGDFQGLPVGSPFAQFMASRTLRKAKDIESKLEEKGVFTLARMGIELVKARLNKQS